jgi:hypothetical protein
MNRTALAAALLCSTMCASPVWAQAAKPAAKASTAAKPATGTTGSTAPATPAKFTQPLKGLAHIQVIQGPTKTVGNDIVTTIKIRNVSDAPIALLRADELWYNKARSTQISGDSYSHKRPFLPGEVIEVTFHAPMPANKADVGPSQYMFSHVNGKVDVKAVKKFE